MERRRAGAIGREDGLHGCRRFVQHERLDQAGGAQRPGLAVHDGRGGQHHFQVGGAGHHHPALDLVIAQHCRPVGGQLRLEDLVVRRQRQTAAQQRMKDGTAACGKPYGALRRGVPRPCPSRNAAFERDSWGPPSSAARSRDPRLPNRSSPRGRTTAPGCPAGSCQSSHPGRSEGSQAWPFSGRHRRRHAEQNRAGTDFQEDLGSRQSANACTLSANRTGERAWRVQ